MQKMISNNKGPDHKNLSLFSKKKKIKQLNIETATSPSVSYLKIYRQMN